MTEDADKYLYAQVLAARAKAVECMMAAEINGKTETDAYMVARNLETDMQRIMHNQFEI